MTKQKIDHLEIDLDDNNGNVDKTAVSLLFEMLIKEKRDERSWRRIKRITWLSITVCITLYWFAYYVTGLGFAVMPSNKTTAILPIEGVIAAGRPASADALIPVLDSLFANDDIVAIVLQIKSGGGSPNESERITAFIDRKKKETGKKVVAVCDGICASAAYMIGIHADEFYSSRYSLVGSVGAIMQSWDFHETIKLAKADYRVFASGEMKDLMNSYKPLDSAKEEKLQSIVNEMAQVFKDEVRKFRGDKLVSERDLFNGEVWVGEEAYKLGLVDGIGTLEDIARRIDPDAELQRYVSRKDRSSWLGKLLSNVGEDLIELTLERVGINSSDDANSPVRF